MACFCRAPRYRTAVRRAECCDGAAPVGARPKHILAAVAAGSCSWPMRHSHRGAELNARRELGGTARSLRPCGRPSGDGQRPPGRRPFPIHGAWLHREGPRIRGQLVCLLACGLRAVPPSGLRRQFTVGPGGLDAGGLAAGLPPRAATGGVRVARGCSCGGSP